MSVNSVVELAAAYATIPLAIVGFGFTIYQISKTRKAAEAAADAARSTQYGIIRNSLLILIPQLQRVEEELERAVRAESDDLVVTWLSNWRWQAGQVRGLLAQASPQNRKVLSSLQSSIAMAAQVKSAIIDGPLEELPIITKAARDAIADVTNELGALAATQGVQIIDRGPQNDHRPAVG
jgi:hypothetical protein